MALTWPTPMPTSNFQSPTSWKIVPVTTRTRLKGGAAYGRKTGVSSWLVKITTFPLYLDDLGKWQAFVDSQRGGVKGCLLYNPRRRVPYNYRATDMAGLVKAVGGGAFNGTANLTSVPDAQSIAVDGCPAAFVLKAGDLVGLVQSSRYSLHRIQQDITLNGSGAGTILVEPEVPSTYTATAVVQFRDALGEFTIDPDSITGDEESVAPLPFSFTARSRLF